MCGCRINHVTICPAYTGFNVNQLRISTIFRCSASDFREYRVITGVYLHRPAGTSKTPLAGNSAGFTEGVVGTSMMDTGIRARRYLSSQKWSVRVVSDWLAKINFRLGI